MDDAQPRRAQFVIAKNPDGTSSLPYLVRLPIDGGIILKVRDTWPKTARVYCHPHHGPWPEGAEIVEETPIVLCNHAGTPRICKGFRPPSLFALLSFCPAN